MAKAENKEAVVETGKRTYSKEFISEGATFTGHPYKCFEMLLNKGLVTSQAIENITKFTGVKP